MVTGKIKLTLKMFLSRAPHETQGLLVHLRFHVIITSVSDRLLCTYYSLEFFSLRMFLFPNSRIKFVSFNRLKCLPPLENYIRLIAGKHPQHYVNFFRQLTELSCFCSFLLLEKKV